MDLNDDGKTEPASTVTISNLLHEHDTANLLDVKLGTSTLTMRAAKKGRAEEQAKKDAKRITKEFGFCLTGYCTKDKDGKKLENKPKVMAEVNKDNVREHLKKLFMHEGKVNQKATQEVCKQIDPIIAHFKNVNTFEIRGASFFFVLDHDKDSYDVSMIDLASFEFKQKTDEGILFGMENLKDIISKLN